MAKKKQDAAPPEEDMELAVGTIEADTLTKALPAEATAEETEPDPVPAGAEPQQEESPPPEAEAGNPPQEPPTAPETAEPEENAPAPMEDERAALARERAEFEQEKAAFAHQQLVTSVAGVLQDKGIPVEFAPWITGADAEASAANVEALEAALSKYFDLRLAERMRGGNPPDAARDRAYSREKLRGMSAAEINAQWADISAALSRR